MISRSLLYWKKKQTNKGYSCHPGRDWQGLKQLPDWIMYGQKFVWKLMVTQNRKNKQKWVKEHQSLTMLEEWKEFTLSIQMTKSTNIFQECKKNRKNPWSHPCSAKDHRALRKWLQSRTVQQSRIPKCKVVWWGFMNPQDNEQNLRNPTNTKITLRVMSLFWWHVTISSSRCHKQWKYQMQRGMLSPRHVHNRRRRTREGPELACAQKLLLLGWYKLTKRAN